MSPQSSSIKLYLKEIGQIDLLTPDEEVELAHYIKKGSEEAKRKLIRANLRLVVKIAQDYAQLGLPLLDLISEGNIGLIKAVERFDPKKGGKLSTYAAWWIKQSIKRALANQSKTIRLPTHLVDKIAKMRRIEHKLAEELGREPNNDEVAKKLNVSAATIDNWKTVAIRPASLDAPIGDDENSGLGEIIGDDRIKTPFDDINDNQLREEVERMITKLDEREKEILKYRYGLFGVEVETLEEVGERFNITRERVRQIQNSAVVKLREMMEQDNPFKGEEYRYEHRRGKKNHPRHP